MCTPRAAALSSPPPSPREISAWYRLTGVFMRRFPCAGFFEAHFAVARVVASVVGADRVARVTFHMTSAEEALVMHVIDAGAA